MTGKAFLENSNEIYEGLPAYLLSHAFVHQWLEWIEDPIEIPRPVFSNAPLRCVHNRLHVDLEWFPDRRAGIFTVVYDDLWNRIVSLYVLFSVLGTRLRLRTDTHFARAGMTSPRRRVCAWNGKEGIIDSSRI